MKLNRINSIIFLLLFVGFLLFLNYFPFTSESKYDSFNDLGNFSLNSTLEKYANYGKANNSIFLYFDKLVSLFGTENYVAYFNYDVFVEIPYVCDIDFVTDQYVLTKTIILDNFESGFFTMNVTLPQFDKLLVYYDCEFK